MADTNINRWVAVIRWARLHEASELRRKKRDTQMLDLRGRWLTAMKCAELANERKSR